ncbi:Putative adipose-regulatory protein (Seipin [Striga hermonthica]|uniref:Adipose-regulatory protein (Seipin) n=1 Tax=Striga hermonthica TaxID=68872 RepID=A0A9N7R5D7_STRHE|nr:Putative adipose-regulatory protein (Seipin [Striga hermonthica]
MASSENEVLNDIPNFLPSPFLFFTNLLTLQAQIFSTCLLSLASPFFSIFSFFFRRPAGNDYPKRDGSRLLGRIAAGLMAAAYVCVVLMSALAVAVVLGVGLVRAWAEGPIYTRAGLQFDYSEAHPVAVVRLGPAAPVGHTYHVSLLLLMPESDYNRDLGIFQLSAELVSAQGDIIAKSSHPCMLRFRSWPIRLTRTFLMGLPLILGITTETQTITFPILKHKESSSHPRTEYIRITMIPRAGTESLPQFYDAEVLVRSQPPWAKEFVHRWKLTFCVWTTMYVFVILLVMVLVSFLKPLIFPVMVVTTRDLISSDKRASVNTWQQHSRSKRKAAINVLHAPATSISASHGMDFEEGSGDSSESVCFYK